MNYKELHKQRKQEHIKLQDIQAIFPSDDSILAHIFKFRYGNCKVCNKCDKPFKYYKLSGRKQYNCKYCNNQISPLANTIFHKSSTPLSVWLYAAYEIAIAKNGISGLELQRKIGTTYKTAWRMLHKIRALMVTSGYPLLEGTIEIDESYVGKRVSNNQSAIIGAVDRETNETRLQHIGIPSVQNINEFVRLNVNKLNATVYTDGNPIYNRMGLKQHDSVVHWRGEFKRGDVHTMTIDKLWGQIKRSIKGTYTSVSLKYLQSYLNEFAFRRSLVGRQVFPVLLQLLPQSVRS